MYCTLHCTQYCTLYLAIKSKKHQSGRDGIISLNKFLPAPSIVAEHTTLQCTVHSAVECTVHHALHCTLNCTVHSRGKIGVGINWCR